MSLLLLCAGDGNYPLEPWLLTPVPGPLQPKDPADRFNTAHASMQSIVEGCIRQLRRRFRCLQRILQYTPSIATDIVLSCVALHNISRYFGDSDDISEDEAAGDSENSLLQSQASTNTQHKCGQPFADIREKTVISVIDAGVPCPTDFTVDDQPYQPSIASHSEEDCITSFPHSRDQGNRGPPSISVSAIECPAHAPVKVNSQTKIGTSFTGTTSQDKLGTLCHKDVSAEEQLSQQHVMANSQSKPGTSSTGTNNQDQCGIPCLSRSEDKPLVQSLYQRGSMARQAQIERLAHTRKTLKGRRSMPPRDTSWPPYLGKQS